MHKPCLSLGEYPCDPGRDIIDLLLQKKVDLVLSGHEHLYQRTNQLSLSAGCPSITPDVWTPACVAAPGPDLAKGAGTVFATVGTGGTGLRAVDTTDPELPYFAAWSGSNVTPTWGSIDVDVTADRLDARFLRGSGGAFADTWSITRGAVPANQPPTAVLAVPSCTGLVCTLDASGSTDTDGTVTSWAWTFGDGTGGTGPTTSRTYAASGTYPVTVVVTDDDGATASATRSVTVSGGAAPPLAADDFARTVASGWGSADTGGAWSTTSSSSTSVSGGTGRFTHADRGDGRPHVPDGRPELRLRHPRHGVDHDLGGGGRLRAVRGRAGPAGGEQLLRGARQAAVQRRAPGVGDAGGRHRGDHRRGRHGARGRLRRRGALAVRLEVTGTSPTTVRWKVWRAGAAEPAAWTVTATDTTAGLQQAGHVGVRSYLSGSATTLPRVTTVDGLRVQTVP